MSTRRWRVLLTWAALGGVGVSATAAAVPAVARPAVRFAPGRWVSLRASADASPIPLQEPTSAGPPSSPAPAPSTRSGDPAWTATQGMGPKAAVMQVTFVDVPAPAQPAIAQAVATWASEVSSAVPIQIKVSWAPLGLGVLAASRPTRIALLGSGSDAVWTPIALANAELGRDLDPANEDIDITFSSSVANWYLGVDGAAPPDSYDLFTVALHEVTHGLGFYGLASITGAVGSVRFNRSPSVYDRLMITANGKALVSLPDPSGAVRKALTSGKLYLSGSFGKLRVYAPSSWAPAVSYNHLDESAYARGDVEALMTPQLGRGEVIHAVGPATLGVLGDLGWSVSPS